MQNDVSVKIELECGHTADMHFDGQNPDPNLTCPECGAADRLDSDQLAVVKDLYVKQQSDTAN